MKRLRFRGRIRIRPRIRVGSRVIAPPKIPIRVRVRVEG